MRVCKYPDCSHYYKCDSGCTMHKFPKSRDSCMRWLEACGFNVSPREIPAQLYLCSCHFFNGQGPTRGNPWPNKYKNEESVKTTVGVQCDEVDDPDVVGEDVKGNFELSGETVLDAKPVSNEFSGDCVPSQLTPVPLQTISSYSDLAVPLPPENISPVEDKSFQVSLRRVEDYLCFDKKQDHLRDAAVQCTMPSLSYEHFKNSKTEKEFLFYVGLTPESFEILYDFLGGDEVNANLKYQFTATTPQKKFKCGYCPRDKLLMTLVRLRRGLPLKDIALIFNVSPSFVSNAFYTWVRHMSLQFQKLKKDMFVSVENQKQNPSDCYKPFPNLRCVIDCTEIKLKTPGNLQQKSNLHSHYKGATTVKFLIATSVYGGLSFISDGVVGSMSDRKLFLKSGIMNYLNADEAIMTDKGFDIEADLNAIGVDLLIPAFLGNRSQFTQREMLLNKSIATSRVHVERFIKMMKDFRMIRYRVPIKLLDIVSDIVQVCAHLVNFREPFIQWHVASCRRNI